MGTAKSLLIQVVKERGTDLLLISKQPRGSADDDRTLSSSDFSAQLVLTNTAMLTATEVTRGR